MSLTEISIKRPKAVVMAVLLVVMLGVMGYSSLGADLFPSMDMPIITIMTTYNGAGVNEIENDIIKPIENQVVGLRGVDTISSTARVGFAYTVVQFTMETDMSTAFSDVSQAIADVSGKLPKDASKPSIRKIDMKATPVMHLAVSGAVPYGTLYDYADKAKETLEKIDGVGNVTLGGAVKQEVLVELDKFAIDNYGISPSTVVGKITSYNLDFPAGEIEQPTKTELIRIRGQFGSLDDLKNLRVPTSSGTDVALSEIAKIDLHYPDPDVLTRFNGNNTISITVQKQSDANIVDTANKIRASIESIQKNAPLGVKVDIASDSSTFIKSSLNDVNKNLIEGIITTSLVLFLFMRRIKSSLIVLIAIPTSLVATFFLMNLFGFTLNMMSLMGLSMCIGILVDDSIVVIENIQRHIKMGKNPIQAAIEGRKEIAMAAIAITLCDIVVFGPVAFVPGMVGRYFREFGLTVVFATAFSLLVSFTLTPVLSSRLFKQTDTGHDEDGEKKTGKFAVLFENLTVKFESFMRWSLNNRWKVIGVIGLMMAASVALIPLGFISTEFTPSSDQSTFVVNVKLNPGSTLSQTDEKTKIVENYVKTIPEATAYFTQVGTGDDDSSATVSVNLTDKTARKRSQSEIAALAREWAKTVSGTNITVGEYRYGSGSGSKPISIKLYGQDRAVLKQLSSEVEKAFKTVPNVIDVDSTLQAAKSEINVHVDQLIASQYGFSTLDIANAMRTSINGATAGALRRSGEDDSDIVVKIPKEQVGSTLDVGSLKLMSATGKQAFLSDMASIKVADSPSELQRENRQNIVTVSANIEGRTLGDVNKDISAKLNTLKLPEGYSYGTGSEQEAMGDTFKNLLMVLAASIVLVYMILVVLYESFLTPLIRMLSLPCGTIGALIALAVTGNSLNMLTLIGFIMLDGLASKNGTLLIDYANTLMKTGMSLKESLLVSGTRRLRPIIMTSVTMIIGMIPAAISLSEGAELKKGMAIVLIGGILSSTLLSPVLLSVAYTLIDDFKNFILRKRGKIA